MYKIFEKHYHDKYGEVKEPSKFFIKKKKTFLGITRWKDVTHTECGYCDCYNVATTFKSEEAAREFIRNVLCKNVPREKWIVTPIREMSCNH